MWKVGNIAPVGVLGVDSAYGFNITTERGQPLVFFAYATQAAAEAAAAHVRLAIKEAVRATSRLVGLGRVASNKSLASYIKPAITLSRKDWHSSVDGAAT